VFRNAISRRLSALGRRRRVVVAAGLAAVVAAGLMVTVPRLSTPERQSRAQREPAVGGRTAPPVAATPPATGRPFRARPPVWPTAATVDVDLPATRVVVGGLPVSLSPVAASAPRLRVQTLDRSATRAAGVDGVLVRLSRADGRSEPAAVRVGVDYSAFRSAYGADWASRLRLTVRPECAARTPAAPGCRGRTAAVTNDPAAGTVTASVEIAGSALVALTAGPAGPAGDFSATGLTSSGTWSVGGNSGDFNWTYPMRVPPALGGPAPTVGLAYSSSAVDGRMAASNNQPSLIGEGFDFSPGFIERRYRSCARDRLAGANNTTDTGDQCWATDNAVMSMSGHSGELIRNGSRWHLRADDGIRVERRTGGGNGDNDGEWWVATTTDGTQYWFGGRAAANSTLTVPVYGNHAGEPCHATTFAASWCRQAYRWQLDHVVDTHGNTMTYSYEKETNSYSRAGTELTQYDRSGYLRRIEYGTRTGGTGPAPVQVVFDTTDRCVSGCELEANWPDTPKDQECTAAPCDVGSPTFWTARRLTGVTTRVWDAGISDYRGVDSWTLTQSFLDPGDGTRAGLWLEKITRKGLVGGQITLPDVTFVGEQRANRVDAVANLAPMNWWRLKTIYTETGGRIDVTYSPKDCVPGTRMPDGAAPHANILRCYPVRWTPEGSTAPITDFFHKYVVTDVVETDRTGGAPAVRTHYDYVGNPAWRYTDDDGLVDPADKTWSQWRGYQEVRTTVGATGEQTSTTARYFRGMHGDRLPTGTRTVTLPAVGSAPAVNDEDAFAGQVRETIVSHGPGGAEVSATVSEPWRSAATASRTINSVTVEARFVGVAATHTRTTLDGGRAPRTTVVRSTFDDEYGLITKVDDSGDTAVTGDERCALTDYVRDTDAWIVAAISRQRTFAATCARVAAGGLTDDDVIGDSRTSYDHRPWGAEPTEGEVTSAEVLTEFNGGNPTWLTTTQTTYDDHGRPTATTDARGNTTTTAYTPSTGGPVTAITETNELGWTTTRTLEPAWGTVVSTMDPNNRRTAAEYDALGRITAVWGPGRDKDVQTPHVSYAYRLRNDGVVAVTTATLTPDGGYVTGHALYDGLLRPRQTQASDAAGGAAAVVTDTHYDSAGRAFRTHHPYLAIDEDEAPVPPGTDLFLPEKTIPALTVTTFDGAGRATATVFAVNGSPTSPGGTERWRTTIGHTGDRVDVTPPKGATSTSTVVDAAGRTVATRQYHAGVSAGSGSGYDATTFRYNRKGLLDRVTDPAGTAWAYGYDIRGRLTTMTDPDRGTSTQAYNDVGDLISATDGRGVTLAYTYDRFGRRETVRDGSATGLKRAEWAYDTLANGVAARGLAVKATRYVGDDAYVAETLGFTADYQPNSVRYSIPTSATGLAGSYTYTYTYHQNGSARTVRLPKVGDLDPETLTFTYDALGQPSQLQTSFGDTYVTATDHTSFGELAGVDLRNNAGPSLEITRTYETDTRRLAQIWTTKQAGAATVSDIRYRYDEAGNITKLSDLTAGDHQCFGLDHLRRLTEAWTPAGGDCAAARTVTALGGPAPYWNSFSYDVVGNRTRQVEHVSPAGERTTTYTPVAGKHALASTSTTDNAGTRTGSYTYDAVGNTRTRPTSGSGPQTLTWDAEGRLASTDDTSGVTSYVYDASGGRLIRRDPAGATLYLPGQELRHTVVGNTKKGTRYYGHAGLTVATRSGGAVTWLAGDHQGTTQTTVTATAQTVATRRQTPFGPARGTTGAWPAFLDKGFVGGTQDPTGLTHLGAREYDPAIGRFVSVDPLHDLDDPQSWHGYAYADNSPVTFSDPNGLQCLEECGSADDRAYKQHVAAAKKANAVAAKVARDECRRFGECTAPKPSLSIINFTNGTYLVVHSDGTAIVNGYILPPGEVDPYTFAYLADRRRPQMARHSSGDQLTMRSLNAACGDYNELGRPGRGCAGEFYWMLTQDRGLVDEGYEPYQYDWDAYEAAAAQVNGAGAGLSLGGPTLRRGSITSASSCRGRSFDPDTPVLMADGTTKRIKEVRVGDTVLARDPQTGETAAKKVLAVHRTMDLDLTDVVIRTADGREATIHTTPDHPFWSNTRSAWLDAAELLPGDQVRSALGQDVRVVAVRPVLGARYMYDLTVDGIHTFFVVVGGVAVLVHNDDEPISGTMFRDGPYTFEIYANDHVPPHGHLKAEGVDIQIGQNGKPVDSGVELTRAQRRVVERNLATIRDSLRRKMAEYNRNHPKDPVTGKRC
jgi:RHS repeat-associated protein